MVAAEPIFGTWQAALSLRTCATRARRKAGVVLLAVSLGTGCITGCGTGLSNAPTPSTQLPVSLSTLLLPGGVVGTPYAAAVTAQNGNTPYVFTVASGSLPPGLTLAPGGTISGTPTAAGTSSFVVVVTDAKATAASATLTLTIGLTTPLAFTTANLPAATTATAYSASLAAAGGRPPYVFGLVSGSLPPGLALSSNGIIAGSALTAGSYTFSVKATDAAGSSVVASFNLVVSGPSGQLMVVTATLPAAQVNVPYQALVVAAGGTGPYSFAVTAGALPAGLSLRPDGLITGNATATGTFALTATATDDQGHQASAVLSVTVAAATSLAIVTGSVPNGTYAIPYATAIAASGGTAPYSFMVSGGQLPAGLVLAPNGSLTGSPIVGDATSNFTVTVTDAAGSHASSSYSVYIAFTGPAPLQVVTPTLPTALVNSSYTAYLSTSGGTAPYVYSQASGALPPGMTLSPAGTVTGTSSALGTYTFGVVVTDSSTTVETVTANVQITVAPVSATVTVDTTQTLATVPASFYGLHTSTYDASLKDTASLPGLLARTGISVLRYPGGGYSDNYHWAQYSITPFYTTQAPACNVMPDGLLAADGDFGTFVRLLQASGTQGMITVNYGNSVANASGSKTTGTDGRNTCSEPNTAGQPQEAAAWVAYANGSPSNPQVIGQDAVGFDWKTVGYWASLRAATPLAVDDGYNFLRLGLASPLAIRFWEIGNELYYNGWATNHNSETDNHAPYVYPGGYSPGAFNSRNGMDALSPTAYGTNAIQWIEAMKAVDPTIQIGVDFSSPIATDPIPANWNPDLARAVCAGANLDFAIMHYYPGTYLNVQPGELLRLPQQDIPFVYSNIKTSLQAFCTNGAAVPVYLTETSPNGMLTPGFPQPVLGLFAASELLTSAQTGLGTMEWLEMHDGTYLTEAEAPGPAYFGFQLAHLAAAPGDTLVATTSSSGYVVGYASKRSAGGEGLLLINADPANSALINVQIRGVAVGSTATRYTYGVTTAPTGPALAATPVPIPGATFALTIPPFTAVVLLLQ